MAKQDNDKLKMWQDRLTAAESAYSDKIDIMDRRQQLYNGNPEVRPIVEGEEAAIAPHVRNIIAEMIDSSIDSGIPQPKVTARRQEDEWLAKIIEDMIRNELDRLPMEEYNDVAERTVKIQGGIPWLVEWDNGRATHTTVGENVVSVLTTKELIPQDGVYSGVDDMDYIFVKLPQTKAYIMRRYGIDVSDTSEAEPEIKGEGETEADAMVTQYIAYYRNDSGGIGMYSWVDDNVLADYDDYQARRLRRCTSCGAVMPETVTDSKDEVGDTDGADDTSGDGNNDADKGGGNKSDGVCPYCGGGTFEYAAEDYEEVYAPITTSRGTIQPEIQTDVSGAMTVVPLRIPYYKPDVYPIVLQKNISVAGQFLGDSDVDRLNTSQNVTNVIHTNIIDKLLAGGSYMLIPNDASIPVNARRKKRIPIDNASKKQMFESISMEESIEQDMAYLAELYEEAKQAVGITDSYLGRTDKTAQSGKAKQFAASQSAGRLESKRVMKNAAFSRIFELLFKFALAYADEPRPVVSEDIHGDKQYGSFNKYDFLRRDADGEYYWNDQFLFSCDTAAPLASNREALWQEARANYQSGAYGDPTNINTQLLFWTQLEGYHYPLASQTKAYLENLKQQQEQAAAQQQAMMMKQQQEQDMTAKAAGDAENQRAQIDVMRQAKQDAEKDVFRTQNKNTDSEGR